MDTIFTFSKKVKDESAIHRRDICDPIDIGKIDEVIQKLDNLPRVAKSNLQEIGLKSNPKKWVALLLRVCPDNVSFGDMDNLLSDFTDTMKTRMREESKYALGLLMKRKLVLCHSIFGEETITPEWKIIPRMLDTDNVLRYVCFSEEGGVLYAKYWEKEATSSFIEWLGLPRKKAFLFGGRYRIYCDIDGVTVELQLNEEEMERWLKEHPEIKDGTIRFPTAITLLKISEVRVGRNRYSNAEDFLQDYEAEKYGVPEYQKAYRRITADNLPLLMKYYDEQTRVVRKEGDEELVEVEKSTPTFDIIFADGLIELRASYLEDLAKRFINGEQVSIYHAGMNFKTPPFRFGRMVIYNQLQIDSLTQMTAEYYDSVTLQDKTLDVLLKFAGLQLLQASNREAAIANVLDSLSHRILKEVDLHMKLTKLEDRSIEYKPREYLDGNNRDIIGRLSEDIRRKLGVSQFKIYFVGVEDSGTIAAIPGSRLKNDRIETIRVALEKESGARLVYAIPILRGEEGLLFLAALK